MNRVKAASSIWPGMISSAVAVAVADAAAYEEFVSGKLIGLPGVLRMESHLTMKKIKAEY